MTELERAAETRWKLMNSYGHGPYYDGLITQRIAQLDARIAALKAKSA
jgi:hypothetical protein